MSNVYGTYTDRSMRDEELIALFKEGQQETAFTHLVKRYEGIVKKTTFGMCGRDDGDDVAQEVFVRFFRKIDQFKGKSTLGTYLTRIAINLSLNHLKKRNSHLKNRSNFSDEVSSQFHIQQPKDIELKELIDLAIAKLDSDSKAVVVLRLIDGFSVDETAEILNMPRGTIASKLNRAQKKLQEILKALNAI